MHAHVRCRTKSNWNTRTMIKISWHTFHYQVRTTNPEDFWPKQEKWLLPHDKSGLWMHTKDRSFILFKVMKLYQNASTHQQTRLTCGFQHVYKTLNQNHALNTNYQVVTVKSKMGGIQTVNQPWCADTSFSLPLAVLSIKLSEKAVSYMSVKAAERKMMTTKANVPNTWWWARRVGHKDSTLLSPSQPPSIGKPKHYSPVHTQSYYSNALCLLNPSSPSMRKC